MDSVCVQKDTHHPDIAVNIHYNYNVGALTPSQRDIKIIADLRSLAA